MGVVALETPAERDPAHIAFEPLNSVARGRTGYVSAAARNSVSCGVAQFPHLGSLLSSTAPSHRVPRSSLSYLQVSCCCILSASALFSPAGSCRFPRGFSAVLSDRSALCRGFLANKVLPNLEGFKEIGVDVVAVSTDTKERAEVRAFR